MRTRERGFSLIEVALALAIFATVGLALVGLLGTGLNVSKDALLDAEVTMLIENVQARLSIDPNWPDDANKPVYFDNSGAQVPERSEAAFAVNLRHLEEPAFSSPYLDAYRVEVARIASKEAPVVWMLQRARLAGGTPVPAE